MSKEKNIYEVERLEKLLRASGFNSDEIKLIVAQAAFETGNFTSKIFKVNNNYFGMREPKVRETTAAGTRFAHAFYSSLADCVKDFRLYWDYFKYPRFISNAVEVLPITEKYVKELRKNKYFEAEPGHYLRGLQHYYRLYYE